MSTELKLDMEPRIENVIIGEMRISDQPSVTIVTHSLGSCIGIAAYDPKLRLGGIVNYLLPEPLKRETAELHPLVFGSVAIPAFLMSLFDKGVTAERLIVKIAGGSTMKGLNQILRVGQRNLEAAQQILFGHNVKIAEEFDPIIPARSLSLQIRTGNIFVKNLIETGVEA